MKKQGNEAVGKGKLQEAIKLYTEAIELDPENHVLFSNRSAAFAKQNKFTEALKDAEKTVELNPEWPKVSRKTPVTVRWSVSTSPLVGVLASRATPERELL